MDSAHARSFLSMLPIVRGYPNATSSEAVAGNLAAALKRESPKSEVSATVLCVRQDTSSAACLATFWVKSGIK